MGSRYGSQHVAIITTNAEGAMRAPVGRRSVLRRPLGVLGATLTAKAGPSSRWLGSQDAAAGFARAAEGNRAAATPGSKARAPAVAIAVLATALSVAAPAFADDTTPPATTPATTVPDAPPPDPYHPPAPVSIPKHAAPKRSAPIVHAAPLLRTPTVRSYSPAVAASSAPIRRPSARKATQPHVKRAVHKSRRRVMRQQAPSKPIEVNFNAFANLIASDDRVVAPSDDDRSHYLWLAGFAFALLAVTGLSANRLAERLVE